MQEKLFDNFFLF